MGYNRSEGLAWLETPYIVHTRFEIYDGERDWINLGSHEGETWFRGCDWGGDIDSPVGTLSADVGLRIGVKRISPLVNRTLDVGRAIQLKYALVPPGTPVSAVTTWRRGFKGFIDDIDVAPGDNALKLSCSDQAGLLRDTFIEEASEKKRVFGFKPVDPNDPGMSREEVMAHILSANGMGRVQMYVPVRSQSFVMPYLQARTSVWQALQEHALQIGWDLRYRYFYDTGTTGAGRFQLTFQEPGRGKADADYRLALKDFLSLKPLKLSLPDIRNVVEVTYFDRDLKAKNTVRRAHLDSIARYNRRYMAVQEDAGSLIDTEAEAVTLASAILADLAYPKAMTGFDRLFWPFVELGDVVQLEPDYVTFDVEPRLAVTSYRHTLWPGQERTDVSLRDERPAAAHTRWLERQAGVKGVDLPVPVLPGDRPIRKDAPRCETRTEGPRDFQQAYIIARWDEDPKGIAESYNIRWRLSGEVEWPQGSTDLTYLKMPRLENGRDYEVEIQVSSPRGLLGPWSETTRVRTAVDEIPPRPPERIEYRPPVDETQHVSQAELSWKRPSERDYNYTKVQARYDNESWDDEKGTWLTPEGKDNPASTLYFIKNRWPERAERFWARITHIDDVGNESQTLECGPIQFDGSNVTGAVGGVLLAPTNTSSGGVNGGEPNAPPGDGSGGGGGDGGGGDTGEGGGGGSEPDLDPDPEPIGPGAVLLGQAIMVAPEVFNVNNLTTEMQKHREHMLEYGRIYPGNDRYEFLRAWNGKTGNEGKGGQYWVKRGAGGTIFRFVLSFMTTGDLKFLDYIAHTWELCEKSFEGPGTALGDKQGPETVGPDAYKGSTYGIAPQLTTEAHTVNRQIPLEDGSGAGGYGLAYMLLRKNQNRYSPLKEPVGNRPSTPQYYKKKADDMKDYIVNHYRKKWDDYWGGKFRSGDSHKGNKARLDQPGHVQKILFHPMISEFVQCLAFAHADGGANYKQHAEYAEAKKGVRMLFDDEFDGGQKGTVRWCKTTAGDALYYGQYAQNFISYYRSDGSRYVSRDSQFTVLSTYLNENWRSMLMIKLLSGSDILSDAEMRGSAVMCAFGVLDPTLVKQDKYAGNCTNNGQFMPDVWRDSWNSSYDGNKWAGTHSALTGYDKSGRIEEVSEYFRTTKKHNGIDQDAVPMGAICKHLVLGGGRRG